MKFSHRFFSICTILIVFFSFTLAYGAGPVTFSYAEEDSYGELTLSPAISITIHTENTSAYTCSFEGLCEKRDNKLFCKNDDFEEDKNNYVLLEFSKDGLEVIHSYSGLCGLHGSLNGKYIIKK